jgi:hypothetical protein
MAMALAIFVMALRPEAHVCSAEGCGGGDADVVRSHAAGLGATKFCEDGADAYIVYSCGIQVGELGDGGFEDL